MLQRLDGADRQHRAQRETEIGGTPHLGDRGRHNERQALTAVVLGTWQTAPAAGDEGLIGVTKSGRRAHDAVLQPRPLRDRRCR